MNETAQPKWTVTRATVMAWATDSEWLARTDRKNLVTLIGDLVSLDAAEEQRHATEPSSASPERTGRDHFTEKVLAAAREECAEHASLGTHYAKGYDHAEQPLACNLCSRLTELDFFDRGVLPAPAGSASEPQKCPYSHTKLSDGHGPGEAPHCCYCGFTTCGCPKDWPCIECTSEPQKCERCPHLRSDHGDGDGWCRLCPSDSADPAPGHKFLNSTPPARSEVEGLLRTAETYLMGAPLGTVDERPWTPLIRNLAAALRTATEEREALREERNIYNERWEDRCRAVVTHFEDAQQARRELAALRSLSVQPEVEHRVVNGFATVGSAMNDGWYAMCSCGTPVMYIEGRDQFGEHRRSALLDAQRTKPDSAEFRQMMEIAISA